MFYWYFADTLILKKVGSWNDKFDIPALTPQRWFVEMTDSLATVKVKKTKKIFYKSTVMTKASIWNYQPNRRINVGSVWFCKAGIILELCVSLQMSFQLYVVTMLCWAGQVLKKHLFRVKMQGFVTPKSKKLTKFEKLKISVLVCSFVYLLIISFCIVSYSHYFWPTRVSVCLFLVANIEYTWLTAIKNRLFNPFFHLNADKTEVLIIASDSYIPQCIGSLSLAFQLSRRNLVVIVKGAICSI